MNSFIYFRFLSTDLFQILKNVKKALFLFEDFKQGLFLRLKMIIYRKMYGTQRSRLQ